ncbi:hypothetical protein Gohar_003882 [Gossypium harknessii]|uniref:Uncharacterized protein n=1 Tax=Gossypium harknessii TaxID=34285 RepID=A0A7J9H3D5_9ROSI|nr:hypothetical protein [Gossypium harknessii]
MKSRASLLMSCLSQKYSSESLHCQ